MKKLFTTAFIKANCGCYTLEKLKTVYSKNNVTCFEEEKCDITIEEILNSNIPLKDKYWFFCKKVFTKEQNQQIAINVAEIVLPIYEEAYPENKAPREAIEAAKLYIKGHLSLEDLIIKKRAAYAAYAADAAYTYAAYAAAAYATYAADAKYNQLLLDYLKQFCKNN